MAKLLIIGCGGVASVAIHKCCQNSEVFEEICIASRTKSKCDALKEKLEGTTKTKITTAQVDADDVPALVELIRRIANTHNLTIAAEDAESLGDEMYDAMFDGVDTVEGVVGLLHAAAVQAAEMRGRLEMIEDILGGDYNLDRLRELAEADRKGRYQSDNRNSVSTVYVGKYGSKTFRRWKFQQFGKTVFLTREEAEAALKEAEE